MTKEQNTSECCGGNKKHTYHHYNHGSSDAIYGLGIIGSLFYFLQGATTFTAVIIGIGKAIFWPAFLIFRVLTILHL